MAEDEGIKNTPVTAAGTIELLPCPICCRHWPCACAEDMVEEKQEDNDGA